MKMLSAIVKLFHSPFRIFLLSLAVALALGLAACDSSSSTTPSTTQTNNNSQNQTSTVPVAGGSALPHTTGNGTPELVSTPTFTPSSYTAGDIVTATVQVDSDTTLLNYSVNMIAGSGANSSILSREFSQFVTPGSLVSLTIPLPHTLASGVYTLDLQAAKGTQSCTGNSCNPPFTLYTAQSGTYYIAVGNGVSNATYATTGVAASSFGVTAGTLGTTANPLPLTVGTVTAGWVNTFSRTTYTVPVTSGNLYSISVTNAPYAVIVNGDIFGCSYLSVGTIGSCAGVATAATANPFVAPGSSSSGATYDLLVRAHSLGTVGAPLAVALKTSLLEGVPASPGVNYFRSTVTSGVFYHVGIYNLNTAYSPTLQASTDGFATTPCNISTGAFGKQCFFSTTSTTLDVKVGGGTYGSIYALVVQPLPVIEGTQSVPKTIAAGSAQPGQATATSYYQTAATSGTPITITLSGLSAPVNLVATTDAALTQDLCGGSTSDTTQTTTISCTATPTSAAIYYHVQATLGAAFYSITVQ